MTSILSLSDLVNRMTGGSSGAPENVFWFKGISLGGTQDTWAAGFQYSHWRYDGFPGPGATPGAVAVPTNATAGALPFTDPTGGAEKWLVNNTMVGQGNSVPMITLYDRLLHIGGLNGTTITAQNVQSGSGVVLTRHTDGVGNQIWVEINTAVGTTARTITASYTNTLGTSGRTTTATVFGGTVGTLGNDANLIIPLPLQAGDLGVQSVESVTISASTGTAGDFGVVIAHPLSILTLGILGGQRNFVNGMPGLPKVESGSCLSTVFLANTTSEIPIFGALSFVES